MPPFSENLDLHWIEWTPSMIASLTVTHGRPFKKSSEMAVEQKQTCRQWFGLAKKHFGMVTKHSDKIMNAFLMFSLAIQIAFPVSLRMMMMRMMIVMIMVTFRFRSITQSYYRSAHALILVYDVSNQVSEVQVDFHIISSISSHSKTPTDWILKKKS